MNAEVDGGFATQHPRPGPPVAGILGGMGPAAGAAFVLQFVEACSEQMRALGLPLTDQGYPAHWIAQLPFPDRSDALMSDDGGKARLLQALINATDRLARLGVTHLAIPCNTAHAWHGALQERFPHVDILHIAREVALKLHALGTRRVGLLATHGTYESLVYQKALAGAALVCHVPTRPERDRLTRGIYQGVKAGDIKLARACFEPVAERLAERHDLEAIVVGCTEIPLGLRALTRLPHVKLIDPAPVLAAALAGRCLSWGGTQVI